LIGGCLRHGTLLLVTLTTVRADADADPAPGTVTVSAAAASTAAEASSALALRIESPMVVPLSDEGRSFIATEAVEPHGDASL
jgi:hypothetical protein